MTVERSTTSAVAKVTIAVDDDLDEELAETLTIVLVTGGETVTITVPSNDQVAATETLDSGNDDDEVSVTATGLRPSVASNDGNEKGNVSVRLTRSDTVRADGNAGGGNVRVTVVTSSDANDEIANPDTTALAQDETDGSTFAAAGTSFVIDLDDDVSISEDQVIDVTVSYECGTTDPLALMLYDLEVTPAKWVDAKSKCLPTQPYREPETDDSDAANSNCRVTFTVCHLTQFVVAKKVAAQTGSTPGGVSGAVDETADGGSSSSSDDDGIGAGYVIIACVAGVAVLAVAFFVLRKNKSDDEEQHKAVGAAAPRSVESDIEAGSASSVASSSAASSSAASSSASASSASSASALSSEESDS